MAKKELLSFIIFGLILLSNSAHADDSYIFISLGMPKESLNSLFEEAKELEVTFVLRGLKDNSFKQTTEYLQSLNVEANPSIIIDPNLFKEHDITAVPTFVSGENKLTGNVTIKFAQEKLK